MGGGVPVRRGPLEWRAAPAAASGAPVAAPRSQSLPRRGAARAEPGRPAHRSHRRAPRVKILHLSKFSPPDPGGLEQVVAHLAEGAAARGHEIRVIAATGSGWVRNPGKRITEPPRRGVVVVRLPTHGVLWSQPLAPGYLAAARWPADVVYVHHPHPLADLAVMLSPRRPTVILHHSDVQRQRAVRLAYGPLASLVARRAGAGGGHGGGLPLGGGRAPLPPAPAPATAAELPAAGAWGGGIIRRPAGVVQGTGRAGARRPRLESQPGGGGRGPPATGAGPVGGAGGRQRPGHPGGRSAGRGASPLLPSPRPRG